MHEAPYSLMSELGKYKSGDLPPVHLWHPELEKDIDLVIEHDGRWMYMGTQIKRPRLVRLFSTVLRKEADDYFLVTPVEKCRIQVEDVPFQVVLMAVSGQGEDQVLSCTTDMGEVVTMDSDHPLRISVDGEQWIPYLMIRDGLEARLSRAVYYQLGDLLVSHKLADGAQWLGVWSAGEFFELMQA